MAFVPLSYTPIDSAGLNEILRGYEGKASMKIVDDFEEELKAFTGSPYVLALNSGTAAIHLALKALGVVPGDTVIAPTFTYVATVNPIVYLGAGPALVDSEPTTWNISPELLETAIKDQRKRGGTVRCVIVVHSYGMPAMMDEIKEICDRHDIPILEDAAEALGTRYKSAVAGTLGEVGILSFNNNKIVTTYGGGALITQNEGIYKKALFWSNQSREDKSFYEHTDIGFNYRMGPLNAAAGLLGLRSLAHKVEARRAIFRQYEIAIASGNWLNEPEGYHSNRWLTTWLSNNLNINNIINGADLEKIEFRRFWNPMHLQPYYLKYPAYVNGFSEQLFEKGLCLPSCDLGVVPAVCEYINSMIEDSVTSGK